MASSKGPDCDHHARAPHWICQKCGRTLSPLSSLHATWPYGCIVAPFTWVFVLSLAAAVWPGEAVWVVNFLSYWLRYLL